MVCGKPVVSNACNSHDTNIENTFYSKYGIIAGFAVNLRINCSRNHYPLHTIRENIRYVGNAYYLFPVADRHDFMLHDSRDISENNVYKKIWRIAVIVNKEMVSW